MKRAILILMLATVARCLAISPEEIAAWKIPGECKGQPANGQCALYAFCLNFVLAEKGVESKALAYYHGGAQTHAVVFFRLGAQWYAIDNQKDTPVKIKGGTELQMMRCFDRDARKIQTTPFCAANATYMSALAGVRL